MDASLRARAEQLAMEFAGEARTAENLNGFMRLMMQSALERMLNTEMDVHLGGKKLPTTEPIATAATSAMLPVASSPARRSPNRRNGRSRKTVQGDLGELTIATPRDRAGTFEPQLIGKHQRRLPGFDEKILALYAKDMTTRDIQEIVQQLYGVEVSATLVSEITEDLDAEVTAWRTRPVEGVWPIVYFDGLVVHARGDASDLPAGQGAVVHRASGACGVALREHRRRQGGGCRLEEGLRGSDRGGSRTGVGEFRSSLGGEISDDREDVARQVAGHHHAVRLPAADPSGDLHHQRDRIGQQRHSQVHPQPQDLSQRRVGSEDRVHGHSRSLTQVDDADPQMERGAQPLRHPVRRTPLKLTQITSPAAVTQKRLQALETKGDATSDCQRLVERLIWKAKKPRFEFRLANQNPRQPSE